MATKFDQHSVAQREAEAVVFGPCKHVAELTVRMHPELKKSVVVLASEIGVSVNVFVRRLLLAECQRKKVGEP